MPKNGEEVYITDLEATILSAFVGHLYMTDSEMAFTLRVLADKLDGKKTRNV